MKTFTVAGVSRRNGKLSLRFANSLNRVVDLVRVGHTEVEMITLTQSMTKDAAIKELLVRNFDNGRREITNLLVGQARGAKLKKKTVVVRVPTKFAQELQGSKVEVSEDMTPAEAKKLRDAWNRAHAHLSYDGDE